MKIILNLTLQILLLLILLTKNVSSQNNDALLGALTVGAATAIAIEDNKEVLEVLGTNYILTNYPEYDEFRLSVIGLGNTKKFSDKGTVRLYPFALTELNNSNETNNRKLLLMFASSGWVNEYGLDYTKISWELWTVKEWNNLLTVFSDLNSPITIAIESNQIPIFSNTNRGINQNPNIQNTINSNEFFYRLEESNKNNKSQHLKLWYKYVRDKDKMKISIGKLKFTPDGLKLKSKLIYPFYKLKNDDYIVKDYSKTLKVFSNENALGLFLKKEKKQILIKYSSVNKIHKFLNFND